MDKVRDTTSRVCNLKVHLPDTGQYRCRCQTSATGPRSSACPHWYATSLPAVPLMLTLAHRDQGCFCGYVLKYLQYFIVILHVPKKLPTVENFEIFQTIFCTLVLQKLKWLIQYIIQNTKSDTIPKLIRRKSKLGTDRYHLYHQFIYIALRGMPNIQVLLCWWSGWYSK